MLTADLRNFYRFMSDVLYDTSRLAMIAGSILDEYATFLVSTYKKVAHDRQMVTGSVYGGDKAFTVGVYSGLGQILPES